MNQPTITDGYKKGKPFVYEPVTSCKPPQLLDGYYGTLCWNYTDNNNQSETVISTCAPKVVVIGIHKCGTTDILAALWSHSQTTRVILPNHCPTAEMNLSTNCPTNLYKYRKVNCEWNAMLKTYIQSALKGQTAIFSWTSCFTAVNIVEEKPDHYLVRSCYQGLRFYQSEESRYIITLRNPTDRMLSHYFYFQRKGFYGGIPGYAGNKDPISIGKGVLHQLVERAIKEIVECFRTDGITGCVFFHPASSFQTPIVFIKMIVMGCYSVYLEEVLKFIPKNQLYVSMLEERAADEAKAMANIAEFIGVNGQEYLNKKSNETETIRNKGPSKKPVFKRTIQLLDSFYVYFNRQLAVAFQDKKWLYTRT